MTYEAETEAALIEPWPASCPRERGSLKPHAKQEIAAIG